MNSENMARVLQNMIEEAEENLLYLEKVHEGREHLTSRFAELKEAMDLEAELGGPLLSEDKPSIQSVPAPREDAGDVVLARAEAAEAVVEYLQECIRALLAERQKWIEDEPSVPREMVRQLVVCEMDSHPLRECWSWPKALEIVESFGFRVKE